MKKYQDLGILLLRLATAATFLSAVASRLGFWGVQGGTWNDFIVYTGEVNSFAPSTIIPLLAIVATALEIVLALMLLVGWMTRWAALGSAGLTLLFALSMAYSFGIKSPMDYSVFVDCTAALLLATMPGYRWSLDRAMGRA